MKKLLVCIAFHYDEKRKKYLNEILYTLLRTYSGFGVTVFIDTNVGHKIFSYAEPPRGVNVFHNTNLQHPFHLTWMHRSHIKREIDNYDYFMYIEDDMLLPYENFKNYLENFETLWPMYVPSFIRVEEFEGAQYVSDVTSLHKLDLREVYYKNGKGFYAFPFLQNYHAFWIMPQKQLKETMKPDFVKVTEGREFAAMYTGWELGKPALVEIENGQVSPKCYSYHLPNNYIAGKEKKIKVNEIFI